MGTKKCSKCGKEKSLDNFYINSEKKGRYDESDPRLYKSNCKECHSKEHKERRVKKLSYTQGLYFVYFVYNYNEELIYIGKTNDLCGRMTQHYKSNKLNKEDIMYIEYELLSSLCDAGVREIYYINKYKPILNERDVFEGEMTCTIINEFERIRIYDITQEEQLKTNISDNINTKMVNKNTRKYSKPVYKIDPKTMEVIEEYNTCKEAEEANNISASGVSRAARTGGKAGKFYWRYVYENDKTTDRYKK